MRQSNQITSLKARNFGVRWLRRAAVVAVFAATASWPLWAGSLGLAQSQTSPAAEDAAAAKQTLEDFERAAKPGPKHDLLKPLVGTFAATATYAGPQGQLTSQGTSTNTMIMGGRFLRQDYVGRLQDREFHGLTLTGYDNVGGGFQQAMVDEASTALFTLNGSVDPDDKTFTFSGQAGDPVTGKIQSYRHVLRIESDDRHLLEMYEPDESGQMRKSVVIVYDRVADEPTTQKNDQ